LGNKAGSIDLFWKGMLIVEHKSQGQNLDRAYQQALDCFPGISEQELPKYVRVSDFANLRLYDLEADTEADFPLNDLPAQIHRFGFMSGYMKAAEYIRGTDIEAYTRKTFAIYLSYCIMRQENEWRTDYEQKTD
jgi:hypothetical protein